MTSKGIQTMQKIVIKKPWGVEIKDYKAGDPIPAGVKFKIFDAKDTAKIDAYADSLDESADYQKKRFKEPAYMYNESAKTIKEAQERKKDYLAIVKRFRSDINKHIDKVERDIDRGFAIDYSDRDEAQVLGTRFSAELLRYNLAVENKVLTESFIITDSINGKPTYFHYGKFTGYDWGFEKDKATKFSTKEAAEKMIERMRQEGAIVKDMKVIEEGRIAKGYENLDAEERAKHLLSHPSSKYMNDLKSENITERAIRKAVKEMLGKPDKRDPQFIIDVNEEGEAPAIANTTAEVANPELPLKLKESVLPTENEAWGFFGTSLDHIDGVPQAEKFWDIASRLLAKERHWNPTKVRDWLDSKSGRHFADTVSDFGWSEGGIRSAYNKWDSMGWFDK